MHAGWVINTGGLPYVDIWDHKGPLLFYLNAWGLLISENEAWGVIVLEALLTITALLWALKLAPKSAYKWGHSLLLLLIISSYLLLFQGGNFTESWIFPLQLLGYCYYCLWYGKKDSLSLLITTAVLLGVAGGVAVTTRINNGGGCFILFVILLVQAFKHSGYRSVLMAALATTACFFAVVGSFLLHAYVNGYLHELWKTYVQYNLQYTSYSGIEKRIDEVFYNLKIILRSPLSLALIFHVTGGLRSFQGFRQPLTQILLLIFGTDILFATISGYGYGHYSLVGLASLATLALFIGMPKKKILPPNQWMSYRPTIAFIIAIICFQISFHYVENNYTKVIKDGYNLPDSDRHRFLEALKPLKEKGIAVQPLVYDFAGTIFLAKINSPTRYVFYPYRPRIASIDKDIEELILAKSACLILDDMKIPEGYSYYARAFNDNHLVCPEKYGLPAYKG